jgi:hypothetical protein
VRSRLVTVPMRKPSGALPHYVATSCTHLCCNMLLQHLAHTVWYVSLRCTPALRCCFDQPTLGPFPPKAIVTQGHSHLKQLALVAPQARSAAPSFLAAPSCAYALMRLGVLCTQLLGSIGSVRRSTRCSAWGRECDLRGTERKCGLIHRYMASSPDELALVRAAKVCTHARRHMHKHIRSTHAHTCSCSQAFGFKFVSRDAQLVVVDVMSTMMTYNMQQCNNAAATCIVQRTTYFMQPTTYSARRRAAPDAAISCE